MLRLHRSTSGGLAIITLAIAALTLPARASLVGHWQFEEGSDSIIYDGSGLGNHGTLVNAKANTWTNGHTGGGLYFEGTTGAGCTYVTIPDTPSLHLLNAISFATWVRCDDTGRDAPILDKEGAGKLAYWFGADTGAHFGVLLDTDGNQPWTVMDRDQGLLTTQLWMHIVTTWDATTIRHYLNGVQLLETAAFSGSIFAGTGPLIIGANVPYDSTAFKGIIDDLRLFNHALSQAEVSALAGYTPQLVGHWAFEKGGGTNILDSSSQTNHGTIINLQTNTWTTGMQGSALHFPGVTGSNSTRVAVPGSPSLRIAGDISFAAWVRCDDIRESLLGLRSQINRGSKLHRTVMMGADFYETEASLRAGSTSGSPPIGVGRKTRIENAIIDKNASIGDNCVSTPAGKPADLDHELYYVRNGIVIIPKNEIGPSGAVI